MSKNTALNIAIWQIEAFAFEPMLGSEMRVIDIEDVRRILQSLLPYERECFVDSYKDGYIKHVSGSRCNLTNALTELSQDYFTNKYNNPQGGGGK